MHSIRRDGRVWRRLCERASLAASAFGAVWGFLERVYGDAPLDLGTDDIDDLVRQARNVLVAQVDGDARVLLLDLARGVWAALADVLARVREGGLCEGDHLLVGNGHGRVVAHDSDRDGRRAERRAVVEEGADMLRLAQRRMQALRRRACAVTVAVTVRVAIAVVVAVTAAAHECLCKERRIVYLAALVEGSRCRACALTWAFAFDHQTLLPPRKHHRRAPPSQIALTNRGLYFYSQNRNQNQNHKPSPASLLLPSC